MTLGKGPDADDAFVSFKDLKTSAAKSISLPDAVHLWHPDSKQWQFKVARSETVRVFVLQQRKLHKINRYIYSNNEAMCSATKGGSITGIQVNDKTSLVTLLTQLFPITIDGKFTFNGEGALKANYIYNEESSIIYHSLGDDQKLIFGIPPWVKQALTKVQAGDFSELVIYIKFCSNCNIFYNKFTESTTSVDSYLGTALYTGMFNKTGLKVTFTDDSLTVETYGLTL